MKMRYRIKPGTSFYAFAFTLLHTLAVTRKIREHDVFLDSKMDRLDITALQVSARIGVHDWEQCIEQRLFIDIGIVGDFKNTNDDLDKTIDYDQLSQMVIAFVKDTPFRLIETAAEKIAALIKSEFQVSSVTVRVSKPDAIKEAGSVSITIER